VLGRLQVAVGVEARGTPSCASQLYLPFDCSPGERKLLAYDLNALALHILGKKLPIPTAAAAPPAAATSSATALQQPSFASDSTRASCALAAAVALLELCDEMGCVQGAINVAERSGFAPNLLMKSGLAGAALCMLQRCAQARGKLLPFSASSAPSSAAASSLPHLEHQLHSACICSADALGTLVAHRPLSTSAQS
jgi:hypothetical protein